MKCPECGHPVSDVVDSRPLEGQVWRRRKCRGCEMTWTTLEIANPSDGGIEAWLSTLNVALQAVEKVQKELRRVKTRPGKGKPGPQI